VVARRPVDHKANVQPDPGRLWHETLGGLQHLERFVPALSPHINDSEIRIACTRLRIQCQHLAKILFRRVKPIPI